MMDTEGGGNKIQQSGTRGEGSKERGRNIESLTQAYCDLILKYNRNASMVYRITRACAFDIVFD